MWPIGQTLTVSKSSVVMKSDSGVCFASGLGGTRQFGVTARVEAGLCSSLDLPRSVVPSRSRGGLRLAAKADGPEAKVTLTPTISPPNFYEGWFQSSPDLRESLIDSVRRARDAGVRKIEISFPAVPNLDEVKFGTAVNQRFAIEISDVMGLTDQNMYAVCRRYLVSFANFYWARHLALSLAPAKIWIISTDSVSKGPAAIGLQNVELRKIGTISPADVSPGDVVIVMDPGPTDIWKKGAKLQAHPDCTIIMMNSSFVETYDLCGPLKDFEQVFFLKRVSKGWVMRTFQEPWHCFLEKPDLALELLYQDQNRPKLGYASQILRGESFKRFGIFNDRWSSGFGARL